MMCESDEFNLFLRGPEDYEQSCASLSNVTVRHTRSFYESVFSEYHRSDLTLEMIEQITVYEKLIKSSMNSIKSFRKLAKNVTGIMSNFIESVDLIQDKLVEIEESYISGMREDEENILNKERTETQAHVYSALIQWAKLEILDLEAMLEAIAEKQTLDNSKSKFDARLLKLQKKFTKIQQGKSKLTNLTQFLQIKSRESTISELEKEIHEVLLISA